MGFLENGFINLIENTLTQKGPLYVQYYITARCNLRCQQCNVIYANADKRELKTQDALHVIDNLAELKTSVLLLTGGEPFIRGDLPILAGRAIEKGMHPRIQTNGLASVVALSECANVGVRDISISLDSLKGGTQDQLNGGFENSWETAIETIANVSTTLGTNTFAAFGCVFSPLNFERVPNVIRFATEIGWWVSLVPAHSTYAHEPRSFSTFDGKMRFQSHEYEKVRDTLGLIRNMKKQGFNIYDSDQYLDDLERYATNQPTSWRDRNGGVCDAGGLYFAVLPDGDLAPCCDWRLENAPNVTHDDFVVNYQKGAYLKEITDISGDCSGCLYGSYPEITISARFLKAALERTKMFQFEKKAQIRKLSASELKSIATRIENG